MKSPLLDAFKSLNEVTDEIVAREKRVIKESLEEKDYKVDEDDLGINPNPIENTFTASNLYEGLDDETLDEEILDEKLPKDLAKAYRRLGGEGSRVPNEWTGDKRRGNVTTDYEAANYEEITPEQALQARKDGRIQDLRILKDGSLIVYRDDGYPLTGIEWVDKEDRFVNRNGKEIKDTRLMPLSHVVKIADKIYLTDESQHHFPWGKWVRDGEDDIDGWKGHYEYDYPVGQHRAQQELDMVPDTGKHGKKEFDYQGKRKYGYGTPEYDEKQAQDYLKEVETYNKKLNDLEAKWEAGDISRKEYESTKAELEKYRDRYQNYAEESRVSAIRRRGSIANAAAEKRFALSKSNLNKNIDRYKELKRKLSSANYDLTQLQKDGVRSWNLKGGSYEKKRKEIDDLKSRIADLQKQVDALEAEATDELKQANLDQNAQALSDAEAKVNSIQSELNDLLGRAHKASGKEESLNEAMVNLSDIDEIEKVKEEQEEEKEETPVEQIVDPNATIVDELEKSYVGKAILECTKCLGHHYMDPKELEVSEEKTAEGDKIYNLDFECPTCHAKEGFLLVGQVAELKGDEEQEPEKENNEPEILDDEDKVEEQPEEPVEMPTLETSEEEVKEEETFGESLTDFDEASFDSHMTKYLTEVYSNVESYTSTEGSNTDDGIIIEGLIKFKSGKTKPTTFKLSLENGKMSGLNESFSSDSNIYTIEGRIENNNFITENIIYKYNIDNELVEGNTKAE